jgi:uncharacterized protein YecE (DUF72 family)
MMGHPGLYCGTSGWSYKHWSGEFYPPGTRPSGYLEYYCTKFDCVELNSSFYHLPRPATVEGWLKRSPGNFRYCVKLSRFITHRKRLADSGEALQRFFGVFEILLPKMGPVLIQLPPGLVFDRELASDFIGLLRERYSNYRFAIEVRHRSWIDDRFFSMLHDHAMAFVIADSGPRFPSREAVTADFVYLRFHGAEKLYASDYDETALRMYAEKIAGWLDSGIEVWAFFNNDFGGFAVRNASRLNLLVRDAM